MSQNKVMVWSRLGPQTKETAERIAREMGVDLSEYIRSLVIQDIDKRNIITTAVKEEIKNGN